MGGIFLKKTFYLFIWLRTMVSVNIPAGAPTMVAGPRKTSALMLVTMSSAALDPLAMAGKEIVIIRAIQVVNAIMALVNSSGLRASPLCFFFSPSPPFFFFRLQLPRYQRANYDVFFYFALYSGYCPGPSDYKCCT